MQRLSLLSRQNIVTPLEEVMKLRHIKYSLLVTVIFLMSVSIVSHAQEQESYGKIISIDGQTVTAVFEDVRVSVGEEIEIVRLREIVDPVTFENQGRAYLALWQKVL